MGRDLKLKVKVLHIGNKLESKGNSPTLVDVLPHKLAIEGIEVRSVSSMKNKFLRLVHMSWSIIHAPKATHILIDTYSTSNFWYAVVSGFLARLKGNKFSFILHGGNLPQRFESSPEFILKLFRLADHNILPSYYLLDRLKVYNWKNIVHIPNFIDINQYPFLTRSTLQPRILWVRAFDKVYNPKLAIEVLKCLLKQYPHAELCMVGPEKDGSLEQLKKLVKETALPVIFPGKLSKENWINLSKDYDIFINTTNIDNTPVSVIEAMALGLPVVTTNVGGIPYLIDHLQTGILVEPNDAKAMSSAIINLIENPETAQNIATNARKKAESFDWAKVKRLWLELLS